MIITVDQAIKILENINCDYLTLLRLRPPRIRENAVSIFEKVS